MEIKDIKLTETVQKGGCAAKLPAGELRQVLNALKLNRPPELLVGSETMDDAALWDLKDGRYLVQTLDFFTPIVDDAYSFGQIAAANALSDVYAMGGEPKTAMTILAFPAATLPMELIQPLMAGAVDIIHKAGAVLVGGHSIDDDTLKFGFSVTGFVDSKKAWTNAGAKTGDVLILTKPLGTGTITSALKLKKAHPSWIDSAIQSMITLNDIPKSLSDFSIHAATDITGFSLLGHAVQMAKASGVSMCIDPKKLPVLPGALECLKNEILNKAHRTNRTYVQNDVDFGDTVSELQWLCLDAQTSGGLLLSIPAEEAPSILKTIQSKFAHATIVGEVVKKDTDKSISLRAL